MANFLSDVWDKTKKGLGKGLRLADNGGSAIWSAIKLAFYGAMTIGFLALGVGLAGTAGLVVGGLVIAMTAAAYSDALTSNWKNMIDKSKDFWKELKKPGDIKIQKQVKAKSYSYSMAPNANEALARFTQKQVEEEAKQQAAEQEARLHDAHYNRETRTGRRSWKQAIADFFKRDPNKTDTVPEAKNLEGTPALNEELINKKHAKIKSILQSLGSKVMPAPKPKTHTPPRSRQTVPTTAPTIPNEPYQLTEKYRPIPLNGRNDGRS